MTDTDALRPDTATEDVIEVLLHQHEMVKSTFAEVLSAPPAWRQEPFDRLRALLAMHETAEEMVLRPRTRSIGAEDVAEMRNSEEKAATEVLAELEKMGPEDARFLELLTQLHQDVLTHAAAEEAMEFPRIRMEVPLDEREAMGRRLLVVEKTGPTHPHTSTAGSTGRNWVLGPFASMVDHVRDAFSTGDDR